MASPGRPSILEPGEFFLLALAVVFPIGPRFATEVGNVYLSTALTLVWLAAWTLFVFVGPRGGLSIRTVPQRALFVYGGFIALQVLFHLGGLLGAPQLLLRAVQLFAYLGLFLTVASLRIRPPVLVRLLRVSTVVFALECVVTWLPGHTSVHGFLTGTFDRDHNTFAAYLLLMLCLLAAQISYETSARRRLVSVLLLMAGAACLVLTFSRTAYVAAPLALLALTQCRWGWRPALAGALGLAIALVTAGLVLPFGVRDRFASILAIGAGETSDISFMTRLALWKNAFDSLLRTGFLGVGVFGFQYLDNYFVRALVETGPIGLALFLWFLVSLLRWLKQAHSTEESQPMRATALGLYAATIGLLVVMNTATDMFLVHRVMGLYWVLLGALLAVRHGLAETPRATDVLR